MAFTKKGAKNTTKRWKFWTLFVITPILIISFSSMAIFVFFVKNRISGQQGLEKGLLYAKLHRHTEALEEFKKELIKSPKDANIHYYMGISYFKLKKYDKAESEMKYALNLKPDFVDATIQLVVIHLTTGIELRKLGKDESSVLNKLSIAEDTCKKLIRTNPTLSKPYLLLANIHMELGLRESAIEDFQKALEIEDSNTDIHIALAKLYVQNGNIDLAENLCKRILSNADFENIKIQLLLSKIYDYQGKLDEAITCLKHILEKKPEHLGAHTQLSVLYLKMGKYDSALSEAEYSIKLSPSANVHPILTFVKGCVFLKNKDYQGAITLLKESALKLPTLPETHYYLALALTENGRKEEAKTEFKSSINISPRYFPAHIGLARLFASQGLNNETLKIGKHVLAMYPENLDALQIIGSTYLRMHDYKSAEKFFRKIVALDPSLGDINLAYLTLSTGELNKCIKQCEIIINKNPDTAKAHDILGIAHIRKGEIEKGIEQFKKVIELDKDSLSTYINLAKAYLLTAKKQDAIKTLETLHSINQNNLEARMLLANLYADGNNMQKTIKILKDTIKLDPNYLPAYKLANLYLLEGETKESINLFNKALKLDPSSAAFHAGFAVAYQQENRGTASILYGQKSLELNGNTPVFEIIMTNLYVSSGKVLKAKNLIETSSSLTSDIKKEYVDFIDLCQQDINKGKLVSLALNKAIISKQQGFIHHSIEECKKAITLFPDNSIPQLLLASIYVSTNKKDEAISIFKDVISMDDNSIHARLNLANLLFKQGFSEKATNMIEKVMEIDPENRIAQNMLGTDNLANVKFEITEDEFSKTSPSYGSSFEEMQNNARVQFEKGNYEKCIEYCKIGLEKNTSDNQLLNILGSAFLKKGLLRKAEIEFNKIIDINADFIPAYLGLANVNLKRNQPNIANILYQTVLNIDPTSIEARIGLGNSHYLMGNHQSAIEEFKNILEIDSNNMQTYIALTKSYLAVRNFELANAMIREALNLGPNNQSALSLLSQIYLHNGNIPEAINQLKIALQNNKTFVDAYNLGTLYIHNGNYEKSIALYKQAVEIFPDNAQFWCNLAIAHLLYGDYENARDACSQALTIVPNSIIPNLCMVNVFLSRGEHENASFSLQSIQELHNTQKDGFLDLIKLCKKSRELEKSVVYHLTRAFAFTNIQWLKPALLEYEELAKIIPTNTIAYYAQAEILSEMRMNVQAIKICNKILELNPQSSFTYNKLADIYYRNGQTEEAVNQYKKVVEINPLNVSSYLNLGVLLELRNSLAESVNAYKKVIELNPSSPVAYNNLAWLYATKMQNKLDDALILGKKAKTIAPENAEIIDTLGWLYYLNSEYDKAMTELKLAVKVAPWNPIVRFHLGTLFYKKGLYQMAVTEMERVIKIGKTFPESKKARLIIEEIKLSQSNKKEDAKTL